MHRSIDYYFSLVSPWAYIGHATFMNLTQRHNLDVNFKPVSLPTVFAETGGLPLGKRAPARQRYRIMELQRWREKRGVELNVHPKFWPFNVETAWCSPTASDFRHKSFLRTPRVRTLRRGTSR